MIDQIKNIAANIAEEVISHRRHLHQHPELSFQEFETSKYIQNVLDKHHIEYKIGYVKTGIVAIIEGKNPTSKVIALRGDMDALPIQEDTGLDFASVNEGIMHACGHDMHTSSLLGCAIILNQLKGQFEGTVKCIFQPGEELLPGGAKLMIEEGVLDNPKVEKIFGQHVYPELQVGQVGFRSGMYMASADEIYITVTGKGGHGALPHKIIDPILISSHLLIALQQVVSRMANPGTPSVLSFGFIEGKGATNVIPNEVKLKGTFRTFDEVWRKEAHIKITEITENLVKSMGGTVDLDIRVGYPFLTNHQETTERAKKVAQDYLGAENVLDLDLRMTAEDFAYFSQAAHGCFYRLGTSNDAENINGGLHHPQLLLDDAALRFSTGLMAAMAIAELKVR
jgi:amidohydrolase